MSEENNILDVVIIGGGIAGMTSAIYASRERLNFKLFSTFIGGQFMVSGEVLNYPGIVQTNGIDFAQTMQEQLKFNNIEPILETVNSVEKQDNVFKIITSKNEYISKSVIIAVGANARKLGVPGEDRLNKRGLTYCSICDGPLMKDKEVAIIGGGDAALEAVGFMKNIASKIYLIVRNNELTAHEYLKENIDNPKVEVIYNAKTTEVIGDKSVEGIKYKIDDNEQTLNVQNVIIEIGRVPATDTFKDFVDIDKSGHIVIDCTTKTSVEGVYAAGDCASGQEYQYVIAAGQGAMALIKVSRYLKRIQK